MIPFGKQSTKKISVGSTLGLVPLIENGEAGQFRFYFPEKGYTVYRSGCRNFILVPYSRTSLKKENEKYSLKLCGSIYHHGSKCREVFEVFTPFIGVKVYDSVLSAMEY